MKMTLEEKIGVLQEVLGMMDDIAGKLRSLGNDTIEAYCLADFEGNEGGWLGKFVRDYLEEELQALRRGEEEGETED